MHTHNYTKTQAHGTDCCSLTGDGQLSPTAVQSFPLKLPILQQEVLSDCSEAVVHGLPD